MSGKTIGKPTKTDDGKKDYWNTPWHAVHDAAFLIGQTFELDACAKDGSAAKAGQWITPEQDALTSQWIPAISGAVWCNPPFSNKLAFLDRAYQQAKLHGLTVCVMVPYEHLTKWWRQYVSNRATVVYLPDGRYNFLDDETKIQQSGVNFCSCFVVFTPLQMPTQYVEFARGIGQLPANDNA